jgi:carbon-monoxide dehydrogenase medium subunit
MDGELIADARVGLAAVGPNTAGIPAISQAVRGQAPSEELYTRAAEIASESCSPTTDNRGTAEYKRHLAGELTRRSLRLAVERIRAGAAGDQQRKG